jgi:hypothetical protein
VDKAQFTEHVLRFKRFFSRHYEVLMDVVPSAAKAEGFITIPNVFLTNSTSTA